MIRQLNETRPLPTQTVPMPRRRSNLRIFMPTLAVLVLAIAWSGFWWFAAGQTDRALAEFIAREAEKGRVITCASQSTGGFPFRLEIRCQDPRVDVTRDDGSFSLTARSLVAVAQAYQPSRLVAEVEGPLVFTPRDRPVSVETTWKSAEASLVLGLAGPQRVSAVIEGADVTAVEGDQRRPLLGRARIEAHARLAEGADAAPGNYDLVTLVDAGSVPDLDAAMGGDAAPVRIEFQGLVTRLLDLSPKSLRQRLRDWQQAGGTLRVVLARIDRGPSTAKAVGDLALDAEGRPTGALTVTLSGVGELSAALKHSNLVPGNIANLLGVGLALLGKPTNIDGKPAVEVPLNLRDGRAAVGAFPAGKLPSLFGTP